MSNDARRARELLRLPVFAIAEGRRLGEIASLLVQHEDRSVAAVGISGRAFSHTRYIPFAQLRTIGPDAAMVESKAALEAEMTAKEIRGMDGHLAGRPVVTQGGQKLGEVTGFEVNVASGQIELYRVRPDDGALTRLVGLGKRDEVELPGTMAVALGADALVVQDEAVSLTEAQTAAVEPNGRERARGSEP